MLPPWKRAALEQQNQPKNVIIITNSSSSTTKPVSTVSNSTSKSVVTNSRSSASTVNTVNSINNHDKPRTVAIVNTANQKSPTYNTTVKTNGSTGSSNTSGTYGNRSPLKQMGKSQSIDVVDGGKKVNNNIVSSSSFDQDDSDDDKLGVSDEHCISVHNNPFLRREKKSGVAKTNLGNQVSLGGRQKVQDSTSPTAGNSTSPRVAWNSKSPTNVVNTTNIKSSVVSSKENVTKNNFVIEKPKHATSPTRKVVFKQPEPVETGRQSRSTERKLSVHEIMKQFGRAASHEEKNRIRKQSSTEENDVPDTSVTSPRSRSSARDYRNRERSPSPVKNRYRTAQNSKPRPKSSPVELPTSVILSQGGRSPTSSPQTVRRATYGNSQAQAPKAPISSSSNKKVVINSKSSSPKHQAPKAPAPQISINDKSSSDKPASVLNGSSGGAVLLAKKSLAYDTHDAGRTPPPTRRKIPLPASAIIDLNTKGPIQEASGKPPVDPELIAKEKAASIPKNESKSGSNIQNKKSDDMDVEKPKPNTVSSLLGAFGQNKSRAPSAPVSTRSAKQDTSADAIPYPEDFRRPKSWQEKQQENNKTLPSQVALKQTKPVNSENETNSSISRSTVKESEPVEISPIPRASSETISPIPRTSSETISPIPKSETVSPIPNREIISSVPNTVTQNGHISKTEAEDSPSKGKGTASDEMMAKARALKKVKKKVNYEVIGGNAPTGKPSMQASKSGRNRGKSKVSPRDIEENVFIHHS